MPEVSEAARARVQVLAEHWDWPDPAILEDIAALGEEAIPALADLLTPERLAASHVEEQADAIVYYAMELLAALELPAATRVFLDAFRQVDEEMMDAMQDALQRLGTDAIDGLLSVAADEALRYFPRTLAASGALNLAKKDPALRAHIADGLRPVLAAHLEREVLPDEGAEEEAEEEAWLVSSFAGDLAELADPAARPLIRAAFDAGRIDPDFLTPESVAEDYETGRKRIYLTPRPFLEEYREDWRRHREEQDAKARLAVFNQKPASQPIVLDPRLGRNDPCWCGSGKKYKKCHLAQDEKEKMRL